MSITETPDQTVRVAANGLTIDLDLHQLLTAVDPEGRWLGYDPDHDEDRFEPSSLALQIAGLTADRLVKVMRHEVKAMIEDKVSEVIAAEVTTLVREHIEGTTVQ